MDYIISILPQMWLGTIETLKLFFITIVLSIPLGILLALARVSSLGSLRSAIGVYVWLLRGTPLMLQLMMVYFGPYYIFEVSISSEYRFYAVLIGFVLNYAAYFAEIFRGGIESMPAGQYEAAQVLGFGRVQTFFRIILPQDIKRILPAITNEVITLVKDTSLATVISVGEMFTAAKALASSQVSVLPFIVAGVFYYIMNYVVAWIMEGFEKRMNYFK